MKNLARLACFALVGCHSPPAPPDPARAAPSPRPALSTPPAAASTAVPDAPLPEPSTSAAVPAPLPPAYDLAADRAARLAEAKAELGGAVASEAVGDVFLLYGAKGWTGAAFTQSVALVKSALDAFYEGRFRAHPSRAISVLLFPSAAPYDAYCRAKYGEKCLSKYGFYRPDERKMVMNAGLGLGTLTHELVHPLVEADFPEAPAWLNEGIASLFEAPVLPRKGEIHGIKNWRHPRLVAALASKTERERAHLDTLFGMSDDVFRDDDEDLHYAMARYLCQWLDDHGKLWTFYRAWRDTVGVDPTGASAFATVVGSSPGGANIAWVAWVKAL